MTREYFGTDGVRGRVGEPPITPELVMHLGHAAGEVLARVHARKKKGEHSAVLIGKDTRISGYMLESALQAGLSAAGVDVYLAGPMPTPAVAYLTRALRLQAGIVISGSHNPYDDNGIKFFSGDGNKLPDDTERAIESRLADPMKTMPSAELGKVWRINDAAGRYIEFCKSTYPTDLDLHGLKLVLDCANGATYHVAGPVFHELGAEVVTIGNQPNGLNINDAVGATHPETLTAAVNQHGAELGIAFDGDGDRLIMADAAGRVYDGDQLVYVIARHRMERGLLNGGIVGTLMTNLGLEHALKRLGVVLERANVGDRYVLELLKQRGWQLGGENSGHIICLDKHTTGDGIVSALQVLRAIRETDLTLAELCSDVTLYPQVLINVRVPNRKDFSADPKVQAVIGDAERDLAGQGRVLLRPSGTEPVIRVMVEGPQEPQVRRLAESIASSVERAASLG